MLAQLIAVGAIPLATGTPDPDPTPTGEPITLEEAKANLRVSSPDDDALIEGLIVAARVYVEGATGVILTAREVEQTVDSFGTWVNLYAWPIRSITSVTYLDQAGVAQTLDASGYAASLARRPVRMVPALAGWWPTIACLPSAVTVTVQAGYATPADVPQTIKQAMLLLVTHWYVNRAAAEVGSRAAAIGIPFGVDALLAQHVMWTV